MADDLDGLLDYIQGELVMPAEHAILRRYIRDFLKEMRDERLAFSDATASFDTIADQILYTPGADDVPGNIRRIYRMWYLNGTIEVPIEEKRPDEFRALSGATSVVGNPALWTWYANQIQIYPAPPDDIEIHFDYLIDSTLDAETGEPFSDDPDAILQDDDPGPEILIGAFSNEFFTEEGRALACSYCLIRWGLGRGRDEKLAAQQTSVYNKHLETLRREAALKNVGNSEMAAHWFGD